MNAFTITDDVQPSEIEFDARFSEPDACCEYLFKRKWPNGFECHQCGHDPYWFRSRTLSIC